MTGPEHYREAERLLKDPGSAGVIGAAQVHATLALAAATIDAARLAPTSRYDGFYPDEAWEAVIGQ